VRVARLCHTLSSVSPGLRAWANLGHVALGSEDVPTRWQSASLHNPAPNQALEPTANSVRCAPAVAGGSPRAFGYPETQSSLTVSASKRCILQTSTSVEPCGVFRNGEGIV
jgi:hypothetical protein